MKEKSIFKIKMENSCAIVNNRLVLFYNTKYYIFVPEGDVYVKNLKTFLTK